ncbi:phosphatidylinositol/phosphatidylcholine transfer protein SFH11 [Carex littledalei]|uniref:Phosphatidylinositol/phosphatidylcholine transfer protein SFH11 n=1 Tax=Carex littledalei TaxID=544730 RepID=A0A833RIB2_9POAL|nr:phosphatidylinositol/phosphatidylcholine transfer protein SFH11 [Carex littledalei]
MSFKSVQESLKKISRSNTFKGIFQSIRDPNEEEVVQLIRNQLLSEGKLPEKYDDYHTLLRFLRMRAFNVPKAKEMFLNMVKWREDFGVDAIVKDFKFEELEAVKRCYPQGFHGVDRYGRPLYIERIGLVDLNSLLQATSIDRYIKYHITEQEKTLTFRYPACSLAAKKHIASTTSVLDVKGVGLSNFSKPARELFIEIQKIDSNYYPETLNQLFIINAGSGFRALWRVLKAFLEARTLSKIQVLVMSFCFSSVKFLNIPEFLGGTCTCSVNEGCLMQDKGPWTNPEINQLLEEVFIKGKKFMEERISKETNEPSGRHINPNAEKTPRMTAEEYEANGSNGGILLKINELEGWLKDTKETLQKLVLKQEEMSTLVEDIKKLTSEAM